MSIAAERIATRRTPMSTTRKTALAAGILYPITDPQDRRCGPTGATHES